MKQVVQNNKTGELKTMDVPSPLITPSSVRIRTLYSAISAGTEKTKIDMGKKSLLQKARARPDLVKKVLDKVRKDGLWSTYQMVQNRLNESSGLGYSCVGIVEEVGEWVEGVQVGDTVACAGAGFANHAELNRVPGRLAVKCPPGTPLDQAAFTTIGSIALQGVRQADPKIGEKIVVIGMGLIGQITGHILRNNGCSVFAIDLDAWKLEQAKRSNAAEAVALGGDPTLEEQVLKWSRGRGADAVILAASTQSDQPIQQAGILCRDKGRVVIVGAVGTKFPREPYYMKEIDIRIARSYGPGRYDYNYEELGLDYPVGFVRFTEERNMESFLDLLASKKIDLSYLITHRFSVEQADEAFKVLSEAQNPYLGILLQYGETKAAKANGPRESFGDVSKKTQSPTNVGFIGLGNYATAQILPALSRVGGIQLKTVTGGSGLSAATKGKQYGFERVEDKPEHLLNASDVGTVFIVTRHDSHAQYTAHALTAGKNVFVEKPLCLSLEELDTVQNAYSKSHGVLTVGFNRRFAPLIAEAKTLFPAGAEHILYRVNAGKLPNDHWSKIPEVGGGRIIGEGCHYIDLAAFLAASPVQTIYADAIGANKSPATAEDVHIQVKFENGAKATVVYLTSGNSKVPKEYIEIHGAGRSVIIDDYTKMQINGAETKKLAVQDKGQQGLMKSFIRACKNSDRSHAPIPASQLWNTMRATLAAVESLQSGKPVHLDSSNS